ncbi:MAG TPA: hypothetical protein VGS61_03015 [Acidimicrobiales bacterium]|nr:hypothetical protein [Acidimicrobiales bacterium]
MTSSTRLFIGEDRDPAIDEVASIGGGRGWCNLSPRVVEDVSPVRVNVFGLWANRGTPIATYLTNAPRAGEAVPSTIGVLHTRGRLPADYVTSLIADSPLRVAQNHTQRGLLLEAPADVDPSIVLDRMCRVVRDLCEYTLAEGFFLEVFRR